MTTSKRNTKLALVAGDHDLMKSLMKEALQEVLEGEMAEFIGAAPRRCGKAASSSPWRS
jgi:transposase-like protein